ncbi:hypothetical protein P7K49_029649 [Saguinus oedipus]|uniref:Uncharacterized protein n=1 Tax=Saguinus oedipus TaxID=9490 RepID=A0ABQ9U8L5_SAGOE|nr:hypothetical protein P7K49_029649 [Saguinus oedipus]
MCALCWLLKGMPRRTPVEMPNVFLNRCWELESLPRKELQAKGLDGLEHCMLRIMIDTMPSDVCNTQEHWVEDVNRAWAQTLVTGQRFKDRHRAWSYCKGNVAHATDVPAATSCIPELQQHPATGGSAAATAKVGRSDSAPARGRPPTSRADLLCPGHKPAPAQRIKCDINPGKCALHELRSLSLEQTPSCSLEYT